MINKHFRTKTSRFNIQGQKIFGDKVSPKQKYKLFEIEKFNELKKRINAKISDIIILY